VAAVAPAWIAATLLWWRTPSPISVRLKQARSMEKSNLAVPDNAKRAVSEVLAPDDGENERSDDVCQALLASGMFSKTDPAALSRWCEQLEPVRFPPGHVVGARGDFGGRLYVIVSGKVKVSYRRPGGAETMLTVLGSYEIFGGVQLFDPAACETSVTTLTEVLAVPIGRSYLLMWMAECSEFSGQVLRLFARWAKETTNALTDFAFADVQGRVASRLLWLRKRFGRREGEVVRIVHDLTLEDFSRLVGLSPELIGNTLREFEDRGWIHLDDKSVVVVDSQALASVRTESMWEVGCVRSI
jgi:CRP/FNR family transcriptional regulator, cyclic AMP receptor protein